jgi:hypothetical protein
VDLEVIDDVDASAGAAGDLLAADEAHHTVLLSALQGARRAIERGEALPDGWLAAGWRLAGGRGARPRACRRDGALRVPVPRCQPADVQRTGPAHLGFVPIGRHLHRVLEATTG